MPSRHSRWLVRIGHHVEQGVLNVAAEDVAGHELRGRHVLQRARWGRSHGPSAPAPAHRGSVFSTAGSISKAWPRPICSSRMPASFGEGLVQELGGEHGVGGGDGVVSRQVVVLTGVDDDARIAVDDAGEVLVDDRALHVDVAEQDAVESVVQHNVQTLQSAHGGDLGHAQAGAVVAQRGCSGAAPRPPRPARRASGGSSPGWHRCRRSPQWWRRRARSPAGTGRWYG